MASKLFERLMLRARPVPAEVLDLVAELIARGADAYAFYRSPEELNVTIWATEKFNVISQTATEKWDAAISHIQHVHMTLFIDDGSRLDWFQEQGVPLGVVIPLGTG